MSDYQTLIMLRKLLLVDWQWQDSSTMLIGLSLLGIVITLLATGHKNFGKVALLVNIYPGFCFVVIAIAKIYDKLNIPIELQRAEGANFLIVTSFNFVAVCFFIWALKYRPAFARGFFAGLIGVVSSITFLVSIFVEINHA